MHQTTWLITIHEPATAVYSVSVSQSTVYHMSGELFNPGLRLKKYAVLAHYTYSCLSFANMESTWLKIDRIDNLP